MTKSWYKSKTLWINVAAVIGTLITNQITELIQPYIEVTVLAMINIILRGVTKERISF